ncbi:MAG: HAMP domain-containing histidine kinase [Dorea sp.]|nr:HAMP domain-containing histidine kinase [Dorea sp.]
MRNYTVTYDEYLPGSDYKTVVTNLDWLGIKRLILQFILAIAIICSAITASVALFYGKMKEKQTIKETCRMFREYMNGDVEASKIFPQEYAEAAAQITEIKAAMQRHEQILKEEATRKNDLIAYLAHDLKTPLTSVIGYLSLLDEASDMPKKQKEKYTSIALDKASRLEKLINEFFEITRYNLQQMELEEETIDLYYMLVQMTDEFYPLLKAHGNTAELKVDEDIVVFGDSIKLARVFNNILKNAIAYSYPDSVIEIWTENTTREIHIYFRNKGKTIPAKKLNSIFEKFYRLDESRGTNTGGAGLGLAIAKEIVTLHGGKISAVSQREFTTFCVSLPT